MKSSIKFKGTTLFLIPLVLGCFALSPLAQAVSPPLSPDPGNPPATNTADGASALAGVTGFYNSAFGWLALLSNGSASFNTGVGALALALNIGTENTAVGTAALLSNTVGTGNTANGAFALFDNTGDPNNFLLGSFNTAVGASALLNNTTGYQNTAIGQAALLSNIDADGNTAIGVSALTLNDHGVHNTATGTFALFNNTAHDNTANGFGALGSNTIGTDNTAMGTGALGGNIASSDSVAIGFGALPQNTNGCNIAVGKNAGANLTGNNSGNIDIGSVGVAGDIGTIRIGEPGIFACNQGRTFIAGIYSVNEGGTILPVYINSDGQLGTQASSRRFKADIKPMGRASETILALKPVTFRYKNEIDSKAIPQFGLVAEEVEKVDPDLVVRDADGKPYTVRYDQVNAMLLNEFLKEHKKVEAQQATIGQLKSDAGKQETTISELKKAMGVLTAQLKEQAAQIQKVSAQVEIGKPARQVVLK